GPGHDSGVHERRHRRGRERRRALLSLVDRSSTRAAYPGREMKIVRFKAGDDIAYGLAESEGVTLYQGSPFVAWEATETLIPWESVQLLSPVLPSKVVAVGKNYVDHAAEMDSDVPEEPIIFLKPATSVVGPNANVVYPPISSEVHHEAELAVV